MKTIFHIRDSSGIYGAERVILTLAKNIDKKKFNIELICLDRGDGKNQRLIDLSRKIGVSAFPIKVKGKLDFKSIKKIRKILIENNAAIIHSHDFKSDLYGLLSTLGTPIRRVATAHGSTRDSLVKRFYLFFTENFVYRLYHRIIAVSKDLKLSFKSLKFRDKKITVIQNGIDFSLMALERMNLDNNLSTLVKGKAVFSVIGRLYPDKGHSYFLEAFKGVIDSFPNCTALIVGDGPERNKIEKLVKKLDLEDSVILCGVQKDMMAIYELTDFVVIPSLTEGLPYVLLEAMACKIPIIATTVGDIPRLIKHGKSGTLVAPGSTKQIKNGMIYYLQNQIFAKQMAKDAYDLVKSEYSSNAMIYKTEKIYSNLKLYNKEK